MRGLELARRIPTGIVHINDQTVDDEPNIPFGGIFDSGTGTRFGGSANLEAFTETRWVTIRGEIAPTRSKTPRPNRLVCAKALDRSAQKRNRAGSGAERARQRTRPFG